MTYGQTLEQMRYIGSGLMNKGIESGNLTNIGIYSANRKEVILFILQINLFKKKKKLNKIHFFSGLYRSMLVIRFR